MGDDQTVGNQAVQQNDLEQVQLENTHRCTMEAEVLENYQPTHLVIPGTGIMSGNLYFSCVCNFYYYPGKRYSIEEGNLSIPSVKRPMTPVWVDWFDAVYF